MRSKSKNRRALVKTKKESAAPDSTISLDNSPINENSLRGWIKNVSIGIVICLLLLALIEIGLRLVWTPTVNIEDPFVGFSAVRPLFSVNNGVASISPNRLKYFNKISFPVEKRKNTFRVFSFGESTTYGHPFDGQTSYSRWLEDLLKTSCPEKNIEVINVGGISYASYRIVHLVKEGLSYNPDLVIIYVGHNEFLERRSYSSLFQQGSLVISLRSHLEYLRIYKGLETLLSPIINKVRPTSIGSNQKPTTSNSRLPGRTLLNDEATTILDKSAGLDLYYRDEEFSNGVVQHFAYNLKQMISLCDAAEVPVILVETPSNLKDFSPFKSEHEKNSSQSERARIERKLNEIKYLVSQRQYQKAIAELNEIESKDPLYALTYFLKGKALEGEGLDEEARLNFVKARDLDVCPLRATSPIIESIRRIADENRINLIGFSDFVDSYAKKHGSTSGIPGDESFLDHVHPTIELHQALAALLFQRIEKMGLVKSCRALNENEILSVMDQGLKSLDPSIFELRDLNLAKTLRWAGKKDEARQALLRIAARETDNPEVHKMLGAFALEDHQFRDAIDRYREAVRLSGGDPELRLSLAIALYKAGIKNEAQRTYEDILHSGHDMPEVYANLAMLLLESARVADATNLITKGIAKYPDSIQLFSPYALTLAISGKTTEAIKWMQKAVEAEPGDPTHYYNLAGMYALNHQNSLAFQALNKAIDRGYRNSDKISQDPVFQELRQQNEFKNIRARLE